MHIIGRFSYSADSFQRRGGGNGRRCCKLRGQAAQLSKTRQATFGRATCLFRTCFLERLCLVWGIWGLFLAGPRSGALGGFPCRLLCWGTTRGEVVMLHVCFHCRGSSGWGCTGASSTRYGVLTGCGVQQCAGNVTESRGRLPPVHTP